jgi:putative heme-binding domain-containing protein
LGSGRYGPVAESVIGLDVVLADGRVLGVGSHAIAHGKPFFRQFGPDTLGMFLGDCGALGIKTRATFRLIRPQPESRFLSFSFREPAALFAAMAEVARAEVVSEQFVNTEFTLKDGTLVVGRLVSEDEDKLVLRPSMLAPEMRTLRKNDIRSRESSRISPMPPGLISVLTRQELLDVLAYLEAGGKKDSPLFRK